MDQIYFPVGKERDGWRTECAGSHTLPYAFFCFEDKVSSPASKNDPKSLQLAIYSVLLGGVRRESLPSCHEIPLKHPFALVAFATLSGILFQQCFSDAPAPPVVPGQGTSV